ncbi:hypothetical protein NKH77_11560 [Streptomyces sp. M19]
MVGEPGWVSRPRRPVRTTPSPSASRTAAPSSGWSAAARPAAVTSPAGAAVAASQNDSCWKA